MRPVKRLWLLAILPLLLSGISFASYTCAGNSYNRRYKLIQPKVNITATLTNYVVKACFNGACNNSWNLPDLKTVANGGFVNNTAANSVGRTTPADIDVCDAPSGGSRIKFEVGPGYSGSTGLTELDYQKSQSTSADGEAWLFIGASGVTTNHEDLSLWPDAGAKWIFHDPSDGIDSAGCVGSVTTTGTVSSVTGVIGGAGGFSSSRKNFAHASCMNMTTGFTLSMLYKPSSNPGVCFAQDKGDSGSGTQVLQGCQGSTPWCEYYDGSDHLVLTGSFTTGVWQHHACTYNSSTMRSILNGVSLGTLSYSNASLTTNTNPLGIGGRNTAGQGIDGSLDEVRGYGDGKSLDWEQAESSMLLSPTGFSILVDANAPAGLSSGAYCIPVTIDHTKIPTSDISNLQLLFHGVYPWLADTSNGGFAVAGNSGHDIRWYSDSACTSLIPFERRYWVNTTGDIADRVLVSTASHTTDTPVYLKVGSGADTSDVQNIAGTWPSPWIGVYPLGSPSSAILTSKGIDGITLSSSGSPVAMSTPLGGGISFNIATSDTFGFAALSTDTISSRNYPIGSAVRHISCWAAIPRAADCTADCTLFGWGKSNDGSNVGGYALQIERRAANATNVSGVVTNAGFATAAGVQIGSVSTSTPVIGLTDYSWHKYEHDYPTAAGAISGSTLSIDTTDVTSPYYVGSGSALGTTNGSTLGVDQAEVRVCRDPGHGAGFCTAQITECIASSASIGPDERNARYTNEWTPWRFYSLGTATAFSGGGSTPANQLIPGIITLNRHNIDNVGMANRLVNPNGARISMNGERDKTNTSFLLTVIANGIKNRTRSYAWK